MADRSPRRASPWALSILLFVSITAKSFSASAQEFEPPLEQIGVADFNGDKVDLFSNQTWRYDDAGGVRCTPIKYAGELCALPSDWFPLANYARYPKIAFKHGTDFKGFVYSLTPISKDGKISLSEVLRSINYDRQKDSSYGLTITNDHPLLGGSQSTTLVSVIGTSETRVYTYAFVNGRAIIVVTTESPSFMFTENHAEVHAAFVSMLKVAE